MTSTPGRVGIAERTMIYICRSTAARQTIVLLRSPPKKLQSATSVSRRAADQARQLNGGSKVGRKEGRKGERKNEKEIEEGRGIERDGHLKFGAQSSMMEE